MYQDMDRVREDLAMISRVLDIAHRLYEFVFEIEVDMINFMNRTTRWKVFDLEDFRADSRWPEAMKLLNASADSIDAQTAFTALANSVFKDIGEAVKPVRQAVTALGKNADATVKQLRNPAWPVEQEHRASLAMSKGEEVKDQLEKQIKNIRGFLRDTLGSVRDEIDKLVKVAPKLREGLGIDMLGIDDFDKYRTMSWPGRHDVATNWIAKSLSPKDASKLIQSNFLDECKRIRAVLAISLWAELEAEAYKLADECYEQIDRVLEKYPDINDQAS